MKNAVLVDIKNVYKKYRLRATLKQRSAQERYVQAIDELSAEIRAGEILGLVGESGCGKTTLGRLLLKLELPDEGQIAFDGQDITRLNRHQLKDFRKRTQMIFQDPFQSLPPRFTVYETICEPLTIHKIGSGREERIEIVSKMLTSVNLAPPEKYIMKYPYELSGGERQRVSVARALVLQPEFLVADEPVSMLDVSVRAGILNMLKKLRADFNLTLLFITHDLAVSRYISDRVAVMYYGTICEVGPSEEILRNPLHWYTKLLLECVPVPDPDYKRKRVFSEKQESTIPMQACKFAPRCLERKDSCEEKKPKLVEIENDHWVACWHPRGAR